MHFCTRLYTALSPEGKKKFKDVLKRNAQEDVDKSEMKGNEGWKNSTMRSPVICTLHKVSVPSNYT